MCTKCSILIRVVNKHHGHQADGDRKIYIGRGSPLGNPWHGDVIKEIVTTKLNSS